MKIATCFSAKNKKRKIALILASTAALWSGSAYASRYNAHDPRYESDTISDCVHGGSGSAGNIDCSRGRASRSTLDTNAYNADTAPLDGAHLKQTNSPTVDPRDGMTARSEY